MASTGGTTRFVGTCDAETRPGVGAASPTSVCAGPAGSAGVHRWSPGPGFHAYWIAVVGVVCASVNQYAVLTSSPVFVATRMPRGPALAMPPEAISTSCVPAARSVPYCALKSAAVSARLASFLIQSTSVPPAGITGSVGVAGHRAALVCTAFASTYR